VRLAVDINTLIDNPELAAYVGVLGRRYMAHLLPVVRREIDDLKRGARTQQLREAAKRADRRLKELRYNGDILSASG
jgi:KaiC/GvpD/RAD55 family RecA-like ATPase